MINLTAPELKKLEDKTKLILESAGQYIVSHWHKLHRVKLKDKRDVVSDVDIKVETMLRASLRKLLPEAGFVVEEGVSSRAAELNWMIDPIDGTKYFVNETPMFQTQIALVKNDKPILGQIYNPVSRQFFSASLDNGAYLNGRKLECYPRVNLDESIINIDFGGADDEIDWKLKVLCELTRKIYRLRVTGNFLFPYLVTNSIDASLILNKSVKLVDILPGIIIMREAGFEVESLSLNGHQRLVTAGPELLAQIKDIITST